MNPDEAAGWFAYWETVAEPEEREAARVLHAERDAARPVIAAARSVLHVGGDDLHAVMPYAAGRLERALAALDEPPRSTCCDGTGFADYAAVPCPDPNCPVPVHGRESP